MPVSYPSSVARSTKDANDVIKRIKYQCPAYFFLDQNIFIKYYFRMQSKGAIQPKAGGISKKSYLVML